MARNLIPETYSLRLRIQFKLGHPSEKLWHTCVRTTSKIHFRVYQWNAVTNKLFCPEIRNLSELQEIKCLKFWVISAFSFALELNTALS